MVYLAEGISTQVYPEIPTISKACKQLLKDEPKPLSATCIFVIPEDCGTTEEQLCNILYYMMTKYSFKIIRNKFDYKAKADAVKDMVQIYFRNTFIQKHSHELSREQRKMALKSIMTIKENILGEVKGCQFLDG